MQTFARQRWPRLIVGTIGLVAIGAGGAFVVINELFEDTTTPIEVAEVVDDFREDGGSAATAEALPASGVYRYATVGGEEVDALGGTRHDYPLETTITVTQTDCGVRFRWDALEERYEEWELCGTGGTLSIVEYTSFHRFFGQSDRQRYACAVAGEVLPATIAPGATSEGVCESGGLIESTSYEVVGLTDMAVGNGTVEAVHLRTSVTLSGGAEGSSEGELWLAREGGLLLRWRETTTTTSPSAIGSVRYEESFAIEIVSLTPQR